MRAALARWFPSGWVRNAAVALGSIFLVTVGGAVAVWFRSTLTVDQRIAAISAILTGSALLVAVLAAVLAIVAVRISARRPKLFVTFTSKANADGSQTLEPAIFNFGNATAPSARLELLFLRVIVHSGLGWVASSKALYNADVANIHAAGPVVVGSFSVTVNPNQPKACIIWTVAADQVNESGAYLFNKQPGADPSISELIQGIGSEPDPV